MKKLLVFLILISVFFSPIFASPVFAQCLWPDPAAGPYTGVDTGLGCIPSDPQGLVVWFLSFAIKIAGGIALLLLAYGGIKFITSGGDPKALDEAKSTITSALSGLFLIIFSVLLLKIIGYDILRIPGWGPGLTLPGP